MSAVPSLPESLTVGSDAPHEDVLRRIDSANHASTNGVQNGHGTKPKTTAANAETPSPPPAPSTPTAPFTLHQAPVENFRPVRVIVVGAGYSGVYLGIRLPERLRNVRLRIYEKNAGVGGTWWENRYPGCACDIPSHSYQYSFEPNTQWSSLYAPAREIQAYIERTARKYGADRFVRLGHEVRECRFDRRAGVWRVRVAELATGRVFVDEAEVLISARGNLNTAAWPEIDGLESFEGEVMHSARWNENYDFTNKRVGVIGSGSSAIQIVPNLQKLPGTQLSCFIRSKTWISPPFGQDMWDKLGLTGFTIPDDMKAKFRSDPEHYHKFRLAIEEDANSIHAVTIRGTPMNVEAKHAFEDHMRRRLAARPDIFAALLPSFSPGCRRLTPGPGFLEALTEPNVAFVTDPIARIEPRGVRTNDGTLHELDALVCATGFHVSAPPPFPVIVDDDEVDPPATGSSSSTTTINTTGAPPQSPPRRLSDHWRARATSYLSLATDGFPNLFLMLGPNSAIGSGSLTTMIERVGDYVVRCVRKLQRDNIRCMEPHPRRVRDFTQYVDAYFAGTVFAEECRSWYRSKGGGSGGGAVTGLWPGSTNHCVEALRSPRWEDWVYEYVGEGEGDADGDEEVNRMAWLGDGWSQKQRDGEDLAFYLYPEFLDKPVPGRPEDKEEYRVRPFAY
ncbi:flavin-binding monooxygenase [Diplodia corticola]|uniref:L-ornithine N(5)-monooxygenase [NAD(P)H] n=1 Tax=Diplodia corticola TaxID=236234 RepID=A0A1J9RTM6_9PEZI|nr:flavin-binding monooxygenase [Diplodia corticola]OJD31775.1 flavin-binding monooxygenase [Diplodia corticola]